MQTVNCYLVAVGLRFESKGLTGVSIVNELQLEILEKLKQLENGQKRIADAINPEDTDPTGRLAYCSTKGLNLRPPNSGSRLSLAVTL